VIRIEQLRLALAGNDWLTEAADRVAADPAAIAVAFAVAARQCGRAPLHGLDWSQDEAARAILLTSLELPVDELVAVARQLYRNGDAAERRAVLRTLPWLELGGGCRDLLADALRANDSRLVAAAMGPYAGHLDDAAWRQGVLKCVFLGIPLAVVDRLGERADPELSVMLDGLARERQAAQRTMPDDALALLDRLTA
jgi:hypothetical protein